MNKNFQRFLIVWAGQFISAIGAGLTGFAVGVHVFQETGSATNFAMVLLCSFLPAVLLRPLGGVLADRFDRRLMMLAGATGSALSIAGILLAVLSGYGMAVVYMGFLLTSSFLALNNPAYKACVTSTPTEDESSTAGGLIPLASSRPYIFYPAIA